jgi:large subunit ribosomal protein L9
MDVILLERIEKLGQMGDIVRVKPGYARNYLLPQKKAVRATEENRKHFEEQRVQLEATNLERRSEAEGAAARMAGVAVVLIRQAGEAGQLYGSVSTRDIADAVIEAGFTIRRQQVRLSQPIKAIGLYEVPVALHPEVSVTVRVNVARSPDEAEIQGRTGSALSSSRAAELAEVPAAEDLLEAAAGPGEPDEQLSL